MKIPVLVIFAALTVAYVAATGPACDNDDCNTRCVKTVGWAGGFCGGNQCRCWKNTANGSSYTVSPINSIRVNEPPCGDASCYKECRLVGWEEGACDMHDECECTWTPKAVRYGEYYPRHQLLKEIKKYQKYERKH